ncbi:hypothetical protein RI129_010061 [Pyrocoelia pectoralis]|uniref:4-nitrophenylphosphatase n=1 Tax=Pyrocoelia pectoralis TaxID=417401 RepID=A0AAN7V8H3_9COLE
MTPKDLSTLRSSEIRLFLDSFDTVVCDCDGVIWNLLNPIDGVKETLGALKKCGKKLHFVSNNCLLGTKGIFDALAQYHDEVKTSDIITPTRAIISYLKEARFSKEIYILGTLSMKEDFQNAGFTLANTKHDESVDSIEAIQEFVDDDVKVGAVICDYDIYLSNIKLIRATIFLRRPDVLFFAGATDRRIYAGNKVALPGPHFYQTALMEVTGRTPLVFGKPSQNLHNYIKKNFNIVNPSRVLLVGDSISSDIKFGILGGFQTLLVFSGVSKFTDMKNIKKENETPNYYLNSFGDLSEILKCKLKM